MRGTWCPTTRLNHDETEVVQQETTEHLVTVLSGILAVPGHRLQPTASNLPCVPNRVTGTTVHSVTVLFGRLAVPGHSRRGNWQKPVGFTFSRSRSRSPLSGRLAISSHRPLGNLRHPVDFTFATTLHDPVRSFPLTDSFPFTNSFLRLRLWSVFSSEASKQLFVQVCSSILFLFVHLELYVAEIVVVYARDHVIETNNRSSS
ncbi:unnamed protein product [Calypogeia fissa]